MNDITSIGVYFDGSYFSFINSNFKDRGYINMKGFNQFIKDQIALMEGVDAKYCNIVDAHYFRGRFSAKASEEKNQLYPERVGDDVLMHANITTHYLPLKTNGGVVEEKGIDVWLALEALEQSFYKRYSVLVLVAADGDFVPLIRKLNSLGVKVMLLYWDNASTNTRTSKILIDEVTHAVDLNAVLSDRKTGPTVERQVLGVQ